MRFELARYMPRDTPRDTVDEIDKYSYSTVIGYYKFVKTSRTSKIYQPKAESGKR